MMDGLSLSHELAAIQTRTQRLLALSALVHIVAIAALALIDPLDRLMSDAAAVPTLTEITWLAKTVDPPEEKIAPEPARREKAKPAPRVAIVEPVPLPPARHDARLISAKLASGQGQIGGGMRIAAEALPLPSGIDKLRPLAAEPAGPSVELTRAQPQPAAALPLQRERGGEALQAAEAIAHERETLKQPETARQDVAPGVSLTGPIADRRLISFATPSYPDWAKREAVEVSVRLRFTVLPNGSVRENVLVEKTSGFDSFDANTIASLRNWHFEALPPGETAEQWGRITFNYRLRGAKPGELP